MIANAVAISLENVWLHGGVIRSRAPLTVESTPGQWDYAVSVSLAVKGEGSAPRPPITVTTVVTVESGELGCLLVAKDYTTLVGGIPLPVRRGSHTIDLVLEQTADQSFLVFRNTGSNNEPCVFTVESVALSPGVDDGPVWTTGIADLMEGVPPRINIARLREYVSNRDRSRFDDVAVFDRLRLKWSTVPAGLSDRRSTGDLLTLPDAELKEFWLTAHRQATTGSGFPVRGWYQMLYRDVLRGKKVLEIGSGMGIDGIEFARHGARITFVDIVPDNLAIMERLCRIFGAEDAQFVYLHGLASLDALPHDYDIVWCQGSQINAPFEFARRECAAILPHLKAGGRWIELAYPRERWVRDGSPPFRLWGNMTDGEGTPWMEWYDLQRLLSRLDSATLEPLLALNFHHDDFNWFDLVKRD